MEVYAHRGVRSHLPEHTLAGYDAMLKIGADWADMDIALTKEGEIVVTHDLALNPDIVRDPDGKFLAENQESVWKFQVEERMAYLRRYAVKNLTMAELKTFDIGRINPNSAYSKLFPNQQPADGSCFLTLSELVRHLKKVSGGKIGFQIEMKTAPSMPQISPDPQAFADTLVQLLKEEGITQQSEIQSFDFRCLGALQNRDKNIKTAYLTSRETQLGSYGSFPQMVKALGGFAWEPEDYQLTQEALDEAHSLGLKVVVWTWPEKLGTAYDPEMVDKMIDWGVDGIITDDPAQLNAQLASRGLRVPPNRT